MTFVLAKERTFTWPVRVSMPNEEGKKRVHEFSGHFRLIPGDEFNALQDEWVRLFSTDPEASYAKRLELIERVMTGWDGVVDEDNNKIPFTDETLKLACQQFPFVRGVSDAYNEALTPDGKKERRRGN